MCVCLSVCLSVSLSLSDSLSLSLMCPSGLKQGEVCSPVLFSLFINELDREIVQRGRHGIQLIPDLIEIFILLFADDVIFDV